MQIPFPSKGLSDLDAAARQMPLTTTLASDVQTVDPVSGRLVGAQRSGMTKHTSAEVVAGTKVRFMAEFVYDNPTNTYTALGDSLTTDNSTKTPSVSDCLGMCGDDQGNLYVIDGNTAITKFNSELVKQWTIALPTTEVGAIVRCVAVDENGRVFAGVSQGGDVTKAKLWCYEQLDNRKTALLWELTPGYYTEWIELDGERLVAAQNNSVLWQSRVVQYAGIGVPNPTLIAEMEVPYPINQLDVSPKDQSIWTAHEPLANRGFFPRSPETTGRAEDWTIFDLPNVSKRLWCYLDSRDVDGDGTFNENLDDGAVISTWVDKSGNGRNAYAVGTGPTLRKNVLAGTDTLFFNGTSAAMAGAAGLSTAFQYRQLNLGLLPCHAKHQFAVFILCRAPQKDTRSTLFAQNYTTTSNVKDRRLMVNASWFTATFQNANGSAFLYEEAPAADAPWGRAASGANKVPLGGAFDADGLVLYTYVFDHGYDDSSPATRSTLRINGRPVDRWTSGTGYETLTAASLGADVFAGVASNFFQGDILAYVAISDWYETSSGSTTAYTQQKLIEDSSYPDAIYSGTNSTAGTEIEKIEGWMMNGRGCAHKLPSGFEGTLEAVGVVNNNDTVTIDAVTYTFKTTLTPAANEVLRDTVTGTASLRNLHHAINGTGLKGTQYASATTPHPTVWSPGVLENDGTNARAALMVQAREARGSSYTTTVASGRANVPFTGANWDNTNHYITHGSAFASYTFVSGDTVTVTAGTSVTPIPGTYALVGSTAARVETVGGGAGDINGGTGNIGDSSVAGTVNAIGINLRWINGSTSVRSLTASATEPGIYPHTYFLYRTADSVGGPPSSTSVVRSEACALTSPYGLLAKWDPASGRIKDSITTGGPGNLSLGFGGVGYGVRCLDDGVVYSIGPRQAAVTALSVTADNIDWRKFYDTGADITTTNAATDVGAWTAAHGEITYHYPRMDTDDAGNLYVPVYQGSSGTSLIVYRKSSIASGTGNNAALLYSLTSLTGDPKGYCVVVDPRYPDWPTTYDRSTAALTPRSERVYLGTVKDASDVSVFLMREVSVAANSNGPRTNVRLAVSGSSLYTVPAGGAPALVSATAVDSGSRYVDGVSLGGRFFLVDGTKYFVYDPRASIAGGWRAQKGQIPLRAKLIERFSSRLFLAAFGDNRHGWACSEYDDPYGWDFDPPGDAPRVTAAVNSDLSDLGEFPDVINSMCAYRNDVLILGGDHTIAAMTGDPAQGGRFDTIVRGFGIAFGKARCFTPDGRFWFVTTQGELYSMPIGGAPEQVGRHVQRRLSASLDMSSANVELHYDPIERQIRILQMVRGTPSALYTHWRYELETGALWTDSFGSTNVQPTAACLVDGDQPNDRRFLVGCGDGWVRYFDKTAPDDDGVRIASTVRCHLPVDNEDPSNLLFSDLVVRLASTQYGAEYDFFVTDDPEDWGGSMVTGHLGPGENVIPQVRYAGQFCAIDISGAAQAQRWALERITLVARKVATAR